MTMTWWAIAATAGAGVILSAGLLSRNSRPLTIGALALFIVATVLIVVVGVEAT